MINFTGGFNAEALGTVPPYVPESKTVRWDIAQYKQEADKLHKQGKYNRNVNLREQKALESYMRTTPLQNGRRDLFSVESRAYQGKYTYEKDQKTFNTAILDYNNRSYTLNFGTETIDYYSIKNVFAPILLGEEYTDPDRILKVAAGAEFGAVKRRLHNAGSLANNDIKEQLTHILRAEWNMSTSGMMPEQRKKQQMFEDMTDYEWEYFWKNNPNLFPLSPRENQEIQINIDLGNEYKLELAYLDWCNYSPEGIGKEIICATSGSGWYRLDSTTRWPVLTGLTNCSGSIMSSVLRIPSRGYFLRNDIAEEDIPKFSLEYKMPTSTISGNSTRTFNLPNNKYKYWSYDYLYPHTSQKERYRIMEDLYNRYDGIDGSPEDSLANDLYQYYQTNKDNHWSNSGYKDYYIHYDWKREYRSRVPVWRYVPSLGSNTWQNFGYWEFPSGEDDDRTDLEKDFNAVRDVVGTNGYDPVHQFTLSVIPIESDGSYGQEIQLRTYLLGEHTENSNVPFEAQKASFIDTINPASDSYNPNLTKDRVISRTSNTDFHFEFEMIEPVVVFDIPFDLTCNTDNGSYTIFDTKGKYYFISTEWVGEDGLINWESHGYAKDSVFAEIKSYKLDTRNNKVIADSSIFYNKYFFSLPIIGRVVNKISQGNKDNMYPEFTSYS